MKKKSLMFFIIVTLAIAAFGLAAPASAGKGHLGRAVFEADLFPVADHSLNKGRVCIRKNGKFKVKLKGAEANTEYDVYLVYGDTITPSEKELGTLTTDRKGKGKLFGEVCVNEDVVLMPRIEVRYGLVKFVSGFVPVLCNDGPEPDSEPPVEPPVEPPIPGPEGGL